MVVDDPTLTIISYLGGSFGNTLAMIVESSDTGKIKTPKGLTYHVNQWIFNPDDAYITKTSNLRIQAKIVNTTIGQVHSVNSSTLLTKFPSSKIILLSYHPEEVYFILQRLWIVLKRDNCASRLDRINSAFDLIDYVQEFLSKEPAEFNLVNDRLLNINFKSLIDNISLIEQFVNKKFHINAVANGKEHLERHLKHFFNYDDDFLFAWTGYCRHQKLCPINDLAVQYLTSQELLNNE